MVARVGVGVVVGVVLLTSSLVSEVSAANSCGLESEPCCNGTTCQAGLLCAACADESPAEGAGSGAVACLPICVPCGGLDEPCCPGESPCDDSGLGCVFNRCLDCGLPGLGCCDGETQCADGFTCDVLPYIDTLQGGGGAAPGVPRQVLSPDTGGGAQVDFDCLPCGADFQRCCDNEECNPGSECRELPCDGAGDAGTGGGAGNCEQLSGNGGGAWAPIVCVPCGELGEPCCGKSTCNAENLLCGAEVCEACGDIGQQCCGNNTCPVEGLCVSGTCRPGAAPAVSGAGMGFLILLLTGIGAFGMRRLTAR